MQLRRLEEQDTLTKKTDVLGIGCAAIDDVFYVSGIPPIDGKARVLAKSRDYGGLTATALVAAARLGASCRFAGMLGNDSGSISVIRDLRSAGVIVSRKPTSHEARPVRSIIIASVDRGTRAIYFDDPAVAGAHPNIPETTIRNTRVLLLDGYGIDGSIRATEIALSARIPVVADFEFVGGEGFSRLLELVDHLILSAGFARALTGDGSIEGSLRALWNDSRKLVAITDGANGCWIRVKDHWPIVHVPGHRVRTLDTTGCGDVFHGAYAAALAFGYSPVGAISFANVAAALKAAHMGTRQGIPSRGDVEMQLSAGDYRLASDDASPMERMRDSSR
jgi:sugar/nucleoside kinase (ribokinase family)